MLLSAEAAAAQATVGFSPLTWQLRERRKELRVRAVPWALLYVPTDLAAFLQKVPPRNERIFQSYEEARLNQVESSGFFTLFSSTYFQ